MLRSENEEIFGARVLGCSWRMLISVGRQGVGFGLLLSFTTAFQHHPRASGGDSGDSICSSKSLPLVSWSWDHFFPWWHYSAMVAVFMVVDLWWWASILWLCASPVQWYNHERLWWLSWARDQHKIKAKVTALYNSEESSQGVRLCWDESALSKLLFKGCGTPSDSSCTNRWTTETKRMATHLLRKTCHPEYHGIHIRDRLQKTMMQILDRSQWVVQLERKF